MAARPAFDEFDTQSGDIESYLERLEQYFIAYDIDDNADNAAKRKAIQLSSIGNDGYRILKDLAFPRSPSAKTYEQLTELQKGHFKPTKLKVAERYRFHSTSQQQGQSIMDYVRDLKKMAATCEFVGDQLEESLRDRFSVAVNVNCKLIGRFELTAIFVLSGLNCLVSSSLLSIYTHICLSGDELVFTLGIIRCGLRSENIKKKLLSRNFTFQEAVNEAVAQEQATKDVRDLNVNHQYESASTNVHRIRPHSGSNKNPQRHFHRAKSQMPRASYPQSKPKLTRMRCDRCGLQNHSRDECKYRNAECFKCHKTGHLQSECRSRFRSSQPRRVHYTDDSQDDGPTTTEASIPAMLDSVFEVSGNTCKSTVPSLKVSVQLEGIPFDMELDTGAAVSVLNYKDYDKHFRYLALRPVSRTYHTYTGTPLNVAGEIMIDVAYDGQELTLPLMVVHADKYAPPLLGRTWLHKIRMDWKSLFSQGQYAVYTENIETPKKRYGEIFEPGLGTVQGVTAKLHVKEDARPVFQKARPVPFALRPAVEAELKRMQDEGIIVPVEISDWATPLVCVPKVDGTVRLCGDYKGTVNQAIHTEQFPIPSAEEIRSNLAGGQHFSKIDLRCAYQQMILDDNSQKLCTINTHQGLFRYTRLPFGISSSPAIWQRFMVQALAGLQGVCVMLDDVLVTGSNDDEHLRNLEEVFRRFQKYGLRVKPEKCSLMQTSVVYYGMKISARGLQATDEKVEAIRNAPTPQNITKLRSFLGMLAALSNFISNLSALAHPLHELMGDRPWKWTHQCELAFAKVKQALTTDTILAHYDPGRAVELSVDASPYGLGAVIMHVLDDGSKQPIAYTSRTLNRHEKQYGQIDKEALAIIFGLKRFHMYLYGRHFTILTDHKPLERIFGPKTAIPSLTALRLQRWAVILAAYDYAIRYIPSKQNAVADALSRLPLPVSSTDEDIFHVEERLIECLPVTHKEISKATTVDPVLRQVLDFVKSGWPGEVQDVCLKPYFYKKYELACEQNCLLWGLRVIIPQKYQDELLAELHANHPGIVRMKELARSYMWWPNIDKDIESTVRNCVHCQHHRNTPAVTPLLPWIWPGRPWTRVHIDYAEFYKQHFLIIVGAHSRWPEVVWMPHNTSAMSTIAILRNLFAKYGLPVHIVSDNGPQFRSAEFAQFLRTCSIKHVKVAPYHAASNGLAERMVQTFKRYLTSTKGGKFTIPQKMANFLFSYRSSKHPATGCSPASLFLGRELRTRLTLVKPSLAGNVESAEGRQQVPHDIRSSLREFYVGERVLVKDFRQEGKWWSATVAERHGPKSYLVLLPDGRLWKRHVDHLRRDLTTASEEVPDECSREADLPVTDSVPTTTSESQVSEPVTEWSSTVVPESGAVEQSTTVPEVRDDSVGSQVHPTQPVSVPMDVKGGKTSPPVRVSGRTRKAPERLIEKV